MNNYEWLLAMGGEERQAWFDAPHAEYEQVDSGATDCGDTREQLERDIDYWANSWTGASVPVGEIKQAVGQWLDRQAAITEREKAEKVYAQSRNTEYLHELKQELDDVTNERNMLNRRNSEPRIQYDKLKRENDKLSHDLAKSERLCEEMREELSIAYDHAHDLLARRDRRLA